MDTEEIVEGRWDCPSCGHKCIRGSIYKCPKCNLGRGDGVEFYDISGTSYESADIVKDVKQIEVAKAGPDYVCSICRGLNQRNAENCVHCGNLMYAGVREQGQSPLPQSADPIVIARVRQERRKKRVLALVSGAGIGLLIVLVMMIGSCVHAYNIRHAPHDVALTVQSATWTRTVNYQEFQKITQSDWSVPSDGIIIDKSLRSHPTETIIIGTHEVRTPRSHQELDYVKKIEYEEPVYKDVKTGTKKVKVGSENLGNGHFKNKYREEPVYERKKVGSTTKYRYENVYKTVKDPDNVKIVPTLAPAQKWYYTYTVNRWINKTPLIMSGVIDPTWPTVENLGTDAIGNRRITSKDESYTVNLIEGSNPDDGMYHGLRSYSSNDQSLLTWSKIVANVSDDKVLSIKTIGEKNDSK